MRLDLNGRGGGVSVLASEIVAIEPVRESSHVDAETVGTRIVLRNGTSLFVVDDWSTVSSAWFTALAGGDHA